MTTAENNNEDKQNNDNEDDKKSWKSWLPIILMIIAIIIMVYFIFFRGGEEENVDNNAEETPTSTVIENKTGDPQSPGSQQDDEDEEDGQPELTSSAPTSSTGVPGLAEQPPFPTEYMQTELLLPSTEPLTNPVPTTYRGPVVDEPYLFGPDGAPQDKANHILSGMFSMKVEPGNNYKKAFDEIIKKEGTDRAKKLPFKQWWAGPADQHSLAWDVYTDANKKATLSNYVVNENMKHIRDNMVQIDMEVGQTIMVQGEYLRQPNFDFRMYLEYDPERGWLIDDYSFPDENKVPNFY